MENQLKTLLRYISPPSDILWRGGKYYKNKNKHKLKT
jgi:hypothetical protein